ncbi:MAG TPA: hypothetical protein VMT89_02555 [Candidatus Acidoferrales bacterium]|nr:hypothetical protein [Candidatus Acidoferrales bacterium]
MNFVRLPPRTLASSAVRVFFQIEDRSGLTASACKAVARCLLGALFLSLLLPRLGLATTENGVAISPGFARILFDRLSPLREPDGCTLARLDTASDRIVVGLETRDGVERVITLIAVQGRTPSGRRVGNWLIDVSPQAEHDCKETLAALENILSTLVTPQNWFYQKRFALLQGQFAVLAASFVLLVLVTLRILYREAGAHRAPPAAMATLAVVWLTALLLRLYLSPYTFLHEYFHIAETVPAYLTEMRSFGYGNTGPALVRLVGALWGQTNDVRSIFVTTAVVSSLAIPALALFTLALSGSWPRAILAAALLCVFPLHLRFSAAEDLFVYATTFALWSLGLFALYLRTRRFGDALATALALTLAMQSRPEMLTFPLVVIALALMTRRRDWRALFAIPTLVALAVMIVLVTPRVVELWRTIQASSVAVVKLPELGTYLRCLALFDRGVTPIWYCFLLVAGVLAGLNRRTIGLSSWVVVVFLTYTILSLSFFTTPVYNLRSQMLPTVLTILAASSVADVWMRSWRSLQRPAGVVGGFVLIGLGAAAVVGARPFVEKLYDQQLEWNFLRDTVPKLPQEGTLLSSIELGATLEMFPRFLLQQSHKDYALVDLTRVVGGLEPWPEPSETLLFYQGMFCHFAFKSEEQTPDPLSTLCSAVRLHYELEPLVVEDLTGESYAPLRYAGDGRGPFRVGFFRLKSLPVER